MTLDEAIDHCKEVVERYERVEDSHADEKLKEECLQCAADHRRLASWLTELRERRAVDEQRGYWSECYTDTHHYSGICSVCGAASIRKVQAKPYEFCPRCGAVMRERGDANDT